MRHKSWVSEATTPLSAARGRRSLAIWLGGICFLGGSLAVGITGLASASPGPSTVIANQGAANASPWPVSVSNLPSTQAVTGNVSITGSLPIGSNNIGTVNVASLPSTPALVSGTGVLPNGTALAQVIVPAGDILTDVVVNYSGNGVNNCDAIDIVTVDSTGAQNGFLTELLTNRVVNGPAEDELHLQSGLPSTALHRLAIQNGDGSCTFSVFWSGHQA